MSSLISLCLKPRSSLQPTLGDPYDSAAAFFCSKALTLPHMSMILAASGDTGFWNGGGCGSTLGKSFRNRDARVERSIRSCR